MRSLFHFAFHVTDLDEARRFHGGVQACREGRSTDTWVDFDFYGHQISLHLGEPFMTAATGRVGEHLVPMLHFGLILQRADWQAMADRLRAAAFVIEPHALYRSARRAVDHVLSGPLRQPDRGQGLRVARDGLRQQNQV